MKIPTRHSESHEMTLRFWLRNFLMHEYHLLPDSFLPKMQFKSRFLFICGCGHTGTTLVAAKLGNHEDTFLIGRETNTFRFGKTLYAAQRVVREWDHFANTGRKQLVIEKTPKHVQYVKRIRRVIPESQFIVTIRNPLDTVGSIYQRIGNLKAATSRWITDHKAVLSLQNQKDILVVSYEKLTMEPEYHFGRMCDFCGLSWDSHILNNKETAYGHVSQRGTMRKRSEQVTSAIVPRIGTWKQCLSNAQANWVLEKTHKIAEGLGYGSEGI